MILSIDDLDRFNQKKIGILGGSFDPPHFGHLEMAEAVIQQYDLDAFIFVPAKKNPLKVSSPGASEEQRLDMLELLVKSSEYSDFFILDYELKSKESSYAVSTLKAIKEKTNSNLHFVMGADQLDSNNQTRLVKWYQKDQLFDLANLVFVARDSFNVEEVSASDFNDQQLAEIKSNFVSFNFSVSSTEIRAHFRKNGNIKEIEHLIPAEITQYIIANSLYQS